MMPESSQPSLSCVFHADFFSTATFVYAVRYPRSRRNASISESTAVWTPFPRHGSRVYPSRQNTSPSLRTMKQPSSGSRESAQSKAIQL
ncbi:MAG: hypothetical protein DMD83_04725 [Candidatus Rokuibacteriota bacterium]|nr:MAG: hypothetical protein DMD83_04725 [Candidatus Rokubacteria bacterium]